MVIFLLLCRWKRLSIAPLCPLFLVTCLTSVVLVVTSNSFTHYHRHHHQLEQANQFDNFLGNSHNELFGDLGLLRRVRRQISPYPTLPNITAEDVRFAVTRAQEIVSHRFDYFQPQIYNAGKIPRFLILPNLMTINKLLLRFVLFFKKGLFINPALLPGSCPPPTKRTKQLKTFQGSHFFPKKLLTLSPKSTGNP